MKRILLISIILLISGCAEQHRLALARGLKGFSESADRQPAVQLQRGPELKSIQPPQNPNYWQEQNARLQYQDRISQFKVVD